MLIYATEALLGRDEYCMEYIGVYSEGILKGVNTMEIVLKDLLKEALELNVTHASMVDVTKVIVMKLVLFGGT